ncbi:glycoside hydrolase family 88 protein [Joostella atrarenae]|uniref:Glycoside hydrolase family 88 protein n=1 Tax=Joostella atrarenae TaxID=679257 RepID=A0ABS9J5A9_9FLAO|nr:glycoside hydrolase family 88 protein [Joostella atrarenae]MCF8715612.1 glycoside hydrolase family 88 protein [Joostella atrarenae]
MITRVKTLIALLLIFQFIGCNDNKETKKEDKRSIVEKSVDQYDTAYTEINKHLEMKRFIPRSIKNNAMKYVGAYDWTSGFYPGTLWNLYKLSGDNKWKERATIYTEKLDTIQYWEGNHDVGFMIECSFGNGIKYANIEKYNDVVVQTAKSLSTRYRPDAGVIQSWGSNKKWDCPVIIDNMMNLELLFNATKISGDSTYYNIAVTHANTTIKNHFRPDFSSYHVVDYNPETGEVNKKNTHQGLKDESAWARGQAWGLYGYTVSYRETKDPKYLEQAQKIAEFIKNNPNLPKDKVPYWDYSAPASEETPRDASAAAITASALYELATFSENANKKEHKDFADEIMSSLSSPAYFAETGTNEGFLLKHSVGSIPHGAEIDAPLNYADYYYTEALIRRGE